MAKPPNLKAIRTFEVAGRNENFARAAAELHVTQGAVAGQIRGLEADLRQPLFTRHARGVRLTQAGAALHARVGAALAEIDAALRDLSPTARPVTLSVPPSFAARWLMPRLARILGDHPDLDLRIGATERVADFRSDGVDLAVRQGTAPSGLWSCRLAPLDVVAVAAPDLARQLNHPGDAASAIRAAAVVIEDDHAAWAGALMRHGLSPPARMLSVNQSALGLEAAIRGQGIAMAPELLAHDDLVSGQLVKLWDEPAPTGRGFYLVCPDRPEGPGPVATVATWLRREMGC